MVFGRDIGENFLEDLGGQLVDRRDRVVDGEEGRDVFLVLRDRAPRPRPWHLRGIGRNFFSAATPRLDKAKVSSGRGRLVVGGRLMLDFKNTV